MAYQIIIGDATEKLKELDDASIDCVITSPPYYNLRDYGMENQIGSETTIQAYIDNLLEVFTEIKRVLKSTGTFWLNMGDTYRNKQALLIPHKVAIALQNDGWIIRQDIVWAKTNPMPEPAKDRCVRAHEYIFLLSKNKKYYFDYEAIQEPVANPKRTNYVSGSRPNGKNKDRNDNDKSQREKNIIYTKRNKRSVWTTSVKAYPEAHFAVYPPDLIETCILAGCPQDGIVLDPFAGSGTTGGVAEKYNRDSIMIELNPEYAKIIPRRIREISKN
jgi:DNA modification methylase